MRIRARDDIDKRAGSTSDSSVEVIIRMHAKLVKSFELLQTINMTLVNSTMEVIVRQKPIFDEEKRRIIRLQGAIDHYYAISSKQRKSRSCLAKFNVRLNQSTDFPEWNDLAEAINSLAARVESEDSTDDIRSYDITNWEKRLRLPWSRQHFTLLAMLVVGLLFFISMLFSHGSPQIVASGTVTNEQLSPTHPYLRRNGMSPLPAKVVTIVKKDERVKLVRGTRMFEAEKSIKAAYNFKIQFKIKVFQPVTAWSNVFRMSFAPDEDGDRNPALFFNPGTTRFYVRMASCQNTNDGFDINKSLPYNELINVLVQMLDATLSIKMWSDSSGFNEYYSSNIGKRCINLEGKKLYVYLSDSIYEAANAEVQDMTYEIL